MKRCTAGDGSDSTAAVLAWLLANNQISLANLYLIGEVEDPMSFFLTDWESPLSWPAYGVFQPATITRGTVTSKIGLDVDSLSITWAPPADAFTRSVNTASPYQLANIGYYDNWKVRVWTVYMPTPGDANTFGCSELFGGRWASSSVSRGKIEIKVNSFLDIVNQTVPTNVIELQNTLAAYAGATPPVGMSQIPRFSVVTGDSVNQVNGACTFPTAGQIFDTNRFQNGYLVFSAGSGFALGGIFAAIAQNTRVNISGTDYNQFLLYGNALPFPPNAGDQFYCSGPGPVSPNSGFPFVPQPTTSI